MIPGMNVKPRFEVHPRPGDTITETHYKRDAEKGINVPEQVEVPYGYDVFFPNGNSMRVRTDEELKRLGFDNPAAFIDMESGEEMQMQTSLRSTSKARASASKRRADTGGVDAGQGD